MVISLQHYVTIVLHDDYVLILCLSNWQVSMYVNTSLRMVSFKF